MRRLLLLTGVLGCTPDGPSTPSDDDVGEPSSDAEVGVDGAVFSHAWC